jgi:hypothetical protein
MTNENQIILWFPIKLYDKREPNYFVIPNKIIWQTRTKLFCDFPIKLNDKREPNYFVIHSRLSCNFIAELQNKLVLVCHIILLGITK